MGRLLNGKRLRALLLLLPLAIFWFIVHGSTSAERAPQQPQVSQTPAAPTKEALAAHKAAKKVREKVAIVFLVRRDGLYREIIPALENFESRFNKRFGYDYILFSEEAPPPPDQMAQLQAVTDHKLRWSQLPLNNWAIPENIDRDRLLLSLTGPDRDNPTPDDEWRDITSQFSLNYRHMCRFWSGLIYEQPILQPYDWIWRLDGDIRFHCFLEESPIEQMKAKKQTYGFAQLTFEDPRVAVNLMSTIKDYFKEHVPSAFQPDSWKFVQRSPDGGFERWSFYTNFEIVHRSFFDNQVWRGLWRALEKSGGIYYYRWGDAPLHTIYASAYLKREQVAYLNSTGYAHAEYPYICPAEPKRCTCNHRADPHPAAVAQHETSEWWMSPELFEE